MQNEIHKSNFVLAVCTETYERRVSGRESPGVGGGAKFEGAIITQSLYEAEMHNTKFIPVVFSAEDTQHIPKLLRGTNYYNVSTDAGYERLYRHLTGQPEVVEPPLGKPLILPPSPSPILAPSSPAIVVPQLLPSFTNSIGMEFVLVPAGSFVMGSSDDDRREVLADAKRYREDANLEWFTREQPQHEVRIAEPFYLGKYEVTQGEWAAVMGSNPSYFKGDDRLPVEMVSWNDCQEFVTRLNARNDGYVYGLPSEAEWEYACRAGTRTPFSFGETITAEQVNYDGNFPYGNAPKGKYRGKTTRVGSFPPNAWGLHDMHGNVLEWCQDGWHDDYNGAPTDARVREQGSDNLRVLRGGSCSQFARDCRSANRFCYAPSVRGSFIGVRVAVRLATN